MNSATLQPAASDSADDGTLSEERLFDLLGNERRRSCLHCLSAVEGRVTVQDLASQVAVQVSGEDDSPEDIRNSVYISLCQNHLPKLDEADVVDYDSAEKTVGAGRAFPVVERHLQAESGETGGPDRTGYYALVSVATVLVLGVATYAVPAALVYGVPAVMAVHAVAALALGRQFLDGG